VYLSIHANQNIDIPYLVGLQHLIEDLHSPWHSNQLMRQQTEKCVAHTMHRSYRRPPCEKPRLLGVASWAPQTDAHDERHTAQIFVIVLAMMTSVMNTIQRDGNTPFSWELLANSVGQ
jgi:hypothetical protein